MGLFSKKHKQLTIAESNTAAVTLSSKHTFFPGMFVVWKPGLRNRTCPDYNEPVQVTQVLDIPIRCRHVDPGAITFDEPLDLKLLVKHVNSGEICEFIFDSRRFLPVKPTE